MGKMELLVRDVRTLKARLLVCTRCGVCQSQCPLYRQTRREADVSRGKLALIKALIEKMFDDPKGVYERLDRCLLCGSCASGCPSGVNVLEIFLEARGLIKKYLGLSLGEKLVFKKILANPKLFNSLSDKAVSFQSVFLKPQDNVQATSCARFASPLLRHRNIVTLKKTTFHNQLKSLKLLSYPKGLRVAYFVGCLVDKVLPDIALSVVETLQHFKADLYIPQTQGCCGIPNLAAGDTQSFEALVRFNTELFLKAETDYIVTSCATCASTIIKLWPALIKDKELHHKVCLLSQKTVDISWLLVRRFNVGPGDGVGLEKKNAVTCHDPCHLRKSLDVFKEPRTVIETSGFPVVEMKNPESCCGMGGSFNLKHYDLSTAIGLEKAQDIIDTGCDTVTASCPACIMQLSDMLAKCGADIKVKHPIELFADSIRNQLPKS